LQFFGPFFRRVPAPRGTCRRLRTFQFGHSGQRRSAAHFAAAIRDVRVQRYAATNIRSRKRFHQSSVGHNRRPVRSDHRVPQYRKCAARGATRGNPFAGPGLAKALQHKSDLLCARLHHRRSPSRPIVRPERAVVRGSRDVPRGQRSADAHAVFIGVLNVLRLKTDVGLVPGVLVVDRGARQHFDGVLVRGIDLKMVGSGLPVAVLGEFTGQAGYADVDSRVARGRCDNQPRCGMLRIDVFERAGREGLPQPITRSMLYLYCPCTASLRDIDGRCPYWLHDGAAARDSRFASNAPTAIRQSYFMGGTYGI